MLHAAFGLCVLLLIAFLCSEDRARIPWRTVAGGMILQLLFAALLLGIPAATRAMFVLNEVATALHTATQAGTRFVFGYLAGPPLPFTEAQQGSAYILAFDVLPLVLTISALGTLLFHWGILQRITAVFAWMLRRVLGIGGALALGAAVHVFVGMVEAPLLVRPYLARMQRGELFALMSCGMAGVAGTVMVSYADFLSTLVPNALVVKGTLDGIPILTAILAMLLVAVALVTLVNMALGHLAWDGTPLTLQRIFALPFRPVMWIIGVPWAETGTAATLMATKTVLNEFVAYLNFSQMPPDTVSPRTRMILTYALCGFANFGSLGIMVGGLGAMIPERRHEIVGLGLRSILSGTLATCMSGAIAGALV
ncbi:MAG: nucleoside:proton symporter [Rhodospirillales bacterium]|nr:nucleoside:proton symporter [Rhodospirillales bacterium]